MGYEITLAKEYGFCWGVRKAIQKVENVLGQRKRVYCLGPLIHNPQINALLIHKGLKIIRSLEKVRKGSSLIIPSHGLPQEILKRAEEKEIDLVDATCPFVNRVREIISSLSQEGYHIMIIGEKEHKEVKGLVSFAQDGEVIEDIAELKRRSFPQKVGIVAQTTQRKERFMKVAKRIVERSKGEVRLFNTLCKAVQERQKEARRLAKKVEVVLVIGGRNSANTSRLQEICAPFAKTYHIESPTEINPLWLKKIRKIGIITGTSTPTYLVEQTVRRIEEIEKEG
ncbi:MAG: 4-hydroxy-3-methylbut-2-enyl diphosphate reductase [Candidatus Omnitrophota bacterium]|nr:MAG: 4-hydroxy-3-methylbut-2-enyl diphosphate reductase [Candidatus Omnitrophota bacterium]